MRYAKILVVILLSMPFVTMAQHFEGGIFLGTSTYFGDLDTDNFHTEGTHFGYGLVGRYNMSDFVSIRASIMGGTLSADDANNDRAFENSRNLSFRSSIAEFAVIPEFNILGYNPYDRLLSPYVGLGIAVFRFNPQAEFEGQTYDLQPLRTEGQGLAGNPAPYSLTEIAIPVVGGVKFSLSESWNVTYEIGYRFTFTDYIDDVSTNYENPQVLTENFGQASAQLANRSGADVVSGQYRGNANERDRYVYTGFTFTYNFLNGFGGRGYGCPNNF